MAELPEVLKVACAKNRWVCAGDRVEYPLPGGRKQLVFAEDFEHGSERMVRFYTCVGDESALTEIRLRAALSLNFKLPHGAFALHGGHLVIAETFLLREADQDEVEAAVRYLAETADRYERLVYGTDAH
ncbi:MAG: hypothetical protein ACUVYA_04345 [Planctomycetota bacterium]